MALVGFSFHLIDGYRGVRVAEMRRALAAVRRTSVVLNGCRVDPARICNSIRGQSVDMSNTGLQADPRMVEQNSARTANIFVPVKKPNGDEIFEVECGMNTLNQSVSWAHVKTGPPVTDDDAKYLRAQELLLRALIDSSCDTLSSQILAASATILVAIPPIAQPATSTSPGAARLRCERQRAGELLSRDGEVAADRR